MSCCPRCGWMNRKIEVVLKDDMTFCLPGFTLHSLASNIYGSLSQDPIDHCMRENSQKGLWQVIIKVNILCTMSYSTCSVFLLPNITLFPLSFNTVLEDSSLVQVGDAEYSCVAGTALCNHNIALVYQTTHYSQLNVAAVPPVLSCSEVEQHWVAPKSVITGKPTSKQVCATICVFLQYILSWCWCVYNSLKKKKKTISINVIINREWSQAESVTWSWCQSREPMV